MKQFFQTTFAGLFSRPRNELRVSIVINTLNRADSLARTLAGFERLNDPNFETIVVAGPSTDHTDDVLARYAARIRVGRCPDPTLGLSRNIGVEMAAGDIVAFIDDDAVPRADWLDKLRRPYADSTVAGVGGYVYDAVMNEMQWRVCSYSRTDGATVDTPPPHDALHGPNAQRYVYLVGCNMSYRRDCIAAVGGFNDSLRSICDDVEIAGRVHAAGLRVVIVPDAIVDHYTEANHVRDVKRTVRDPYNVVRDFGVLLMHTRKPDEPEKETVAALDALAQNWRNAGFAMHAGGHFSQAEYDAYNARLDAGIRDGLAAGAAARTHHVFAPAQSGAFRPFRA